jgi:hypothetical protein
MTPGRVWKGRKILTPPPGAQPAWAVALQARARGVKEMVLMEMMASALTAARVRVCARAVRAMVMRVG